MKYVNLLLIISLIFCYTGIASNIHHPPILAGSSSNHYAKQNECHKPETNKSNILTGSYKSTDTTKHKMLSCCHYMLPNAPDGPDVNPANTFLYLIPPDLHISVINKASSFTFNLETNREYQPPDLFLKNLSLLL